MADVEVQHPNGAQLVGKLRVWIDKDLCTGDGLCTDIAPDVFTMGDDGIAMVKEDGVGLGHPDGEPEPLANVPAGQEKLTVEAAEECPGECIFVGYDNSDGEFVQMPLEDAISTIGR